MRTDLRAFVWSIVISVTLVLTVHILRAGPVSSEGSAKAYLAGLLYDYQTLVTGLLAIFAAILTVVEMRRSDASSERRHAEALKSSAAQHEAAMKLAVRSDRLRVQRALHPQFLEIKMMRKMFKSQCSAASEMRDALELILSWERGDLMAFKHFILTLYPQIQDVQKLFLRPQFQDGAKLFDGELTGILERVNELVVDAIRAGASVYEYAFEMNKIGAELRKDVVKRHLDGNELLLVAFPEQMVRALWDVMDGMSRMARLYDVDYKWPAA